MDLSSSISKVTNSTYGQVNLELTKAEAGSSVIHHRHRANTVSHPLPIVLKPVKIDDCLHSYDYAALNRRGLYPIPESWQQHTVDAKKRSVLKADNASPSVVGDKPSSEEEFSFDDVFGHPTK